MYSAKLIAAKPNQTKILPFDYPSRKIFCCFSAINFFWKRITTRTIFSFRNYKGFE
jgi:hypothetical protein